MGRQLLVYQDLMDQVLKKPFRDLSLYEIQDLFLKDLPISSATLRNQVNRLKDENILEITGKSGKKTILWSTVKQKFFYKNNLVDWIFPDGTLRGLKVISYSRYISGYGFCAIVAVDSITRAMVPVKYLEISGKS